MSPPALPAVVVALGKHAAFPEFCAKRKNGFVVLEICFAAGRSTKQSQKNSNGFSWMKWSSSGLEASFIGLAQPLRRARPQLLAVDNSSFRWRTPRMGRRR